MSSDSDYHSPTPAESKAIFRRLFWRNSRGGLLLIGVFWLMFIAVATLAYFGIEVKRRTAVLTPGTAVYMASGVTLLGALLLPPRWWRAAHLSRVGGVVEGTVRRQLGITLRGVSTILVTYTVDERPFAARFGAGYADEFAVGQKVNVIYDPQKPTCSQLLNDFKMEAI